jgi:hypothetical protein
VAPYRQVLPATIVSFALSAMRPLAHALADMVVGIALEMQVPSACIPDPGARVALPVSRPTSGASALPWLPRRRTISPGSGRDQDRSVRPRSYQLRAPLPQGTQMNES